MKRRYLILIFIVFLAALTAVNAHENVTSDDDLGLDATDCETIEASSYDSGKLEKTYFYDNNGNAHADDSVVTHNLVKYYGDKDKRFKVKVLDDKGNAKSGVDVYLHRPGGFMKKTTDKRGCVLFPVNYRPGTYEVETTIESPNGFWSAFNKVVVKSTIPTKELVKYSTSKKKFKIRFLDTQGKALKNTYVKLKISGKTYKIKTDKHGMVKIKSKRFKGSHITAYNPKTSEKRKISVVVLKKGFHKINIRIDDPTVYFPTKKLKNRDEISTVYETKYRQYNPGVYVESHFKGLEKARHTKLVKAKFFFKNKKTGEVITKTSSKVSYNTISVKPIKGYSPYKASVWYRDK